MAKQTVKQDTRQDVPRPAAPPAGGSLFGWEKVRNGYLAVRVTAGERVVLTPKRVDEKGRDVTGESLALTVQRVMEELRFEARGGG